MNSIRYIRFYEIAKPLRTTFATSLGRKDVIKSIIVQVKLKNGLCGTGECPTSFTLRNETTESIKEILSSIIPIFLNTPIRDYNEKIQYLRKKYPLNPMTISGLEVALFRAWLNDEQMLEQNYQGGKINRIETDITIPCSMDKTSITRWLRYCVANGFSIFKLKIGGNFEEDARIISFVHETLKRKVEDFSLRLDCNQGYSTKTFMKMVNFIEEKAYNIELIEQPLLKNDHKGLKEINRFSSIPVILDETIFTSEDLKIAIAENLCRGVNIKVAKSGIAESAKIYEIGKKEGLRIMIGCMTETMTGLSAGIYFALGAGGFDYIDLDSIFFLYHRNRYDGIRISSPAFICFRD